MARYRLLIKWGNTKKSSIYESKKPITFSVVDMDRGSYPFNWICTLPNNATGLCRNSSFSQLFREKDSITFAIDLLKKARKEYDDQTIKKEIKLRLDKIQKYQTQAQPSTRVTFKINYARQSVAKSIPSCKVCLAPDIRKAI